MSYQMNEVFRSSIVKASCYSQSRNLCHRNLHSLLKDHSFISLLIWFDITRIQILLQCAIDVQLFILNSMILQIYLQKLVLCLCGRIVDPISKDLNNLMKMTPNSFQNKQLSFDRLCGGQEVRDITPDLLRCVSEPQSRHTHLLPKFHYLCPANDYSFREIALSGKSYPLLPYQNPPFHLPSNLKSRNMIPSLSPYLSPISIFPSSFSGPLLLFTMIYADLYARKQLQFESFDAVKFAIFDASSMAWSLSYKALRTSFNRTCITTVDCVFIEFLYCKVKVTGKWGNFI